MWLARLDSGHTPKEGSAASGDWEARRFFLKGVAYFFIVPEYSRRRDFGRRLQILEKVLDNWKHASAVLKETHQPRALKEAEKISAARSAVFRRYLDEKRTRRYQGQTLSEIFRSVLPEPCGLQDVSFVARVVCTLTDAQLN